MALSAHELILILRARDEASRVLRSVRDEFPRLAASASAAEKAAIRQQQETYRAASAAYAQGQAITTVGVVAAGAGILMMEAFNDASNAAAAYNTSVAKTETQLDGAQWAATKTAISFNDLKNMGRATANDIPAAFGEMQGALYDIFSSIDTTGEGAQELLRGIGKAAVAGQVDMQTAGTGIISILNGWSLSAESTGMASDVLFQLVRKGVGTLDQFTNTIGRSIPSTVKAGGTVQDLAGGMAFLTRQGQSAAMASTAMARAFDLVANPKFEKNLQKYGLSARDAEGNFKPMVDIVDMLRTRMEGMNEGQRADFLKEMTLGAGGTTQAMRFMDAAVRDADNSFRTLTEAMYNATGATEEAYAIMSQTPEAKLQMLSNRFEIFKTLVGDAILPFKMAIVDAFSTVLGWFNSLDPGVQRIIVGIGAAIAVFLTLSGIILAIVGVVIMFQAALALSGGVFMAVLSPVLMVVAAIAALVAIGYLLIANWGAISAFGTAIWDSVVAALQPLLAAFNFFIGYANQIWAAVLPALQNAFNNVMVQLNIFGSIFMDFIGPAVQAFQAAIAAVGPALNMFGTIVGAVAAFVWTAITMVGQIVIGVFVLIGTVIANFFAGALAGVGVFVSGFINVITGFIQVFTAIFTGDFAAVVPAIGRILLGLVEMVGGIFTTLAGAIAGIVTGIVTGVINFFKYLFDVLVGHSIIPDMVNAIVDWIAQLPGRVGAFLATLVSNAISFFTNLLNQAQSIFTNLSSTVISIVTNWIANTISFMATLPGRAVSALASLVGLISGVATNAWNAFQSMTNGGIGRVLSLIGGLPGRILSALGNIGGLLSGAGSQLIQGLIGGITRMAGQVASAAASVVSGAVSAAKRALGIASPSKVFDYLGVMSGRGLINALMRMRDSVGNAGAAMANAAVSDLPPYDVSSRPSGPGGYDSNDGGNVYIDQTINTQEIDPVKQAADLGFEIAGRLGF